jgi:guanylate kinase
MTSRGSAARGRPFIERRGLCLVIAAPSGGGKSSITRALMAGEPELTLSVSVTTRRPRGGERDGIDYHFRCQAEFDALVAAGGLLEWAHVFGRSYGTPRAPVEQALAEGRDVVFDIDWQGHQHLRAALPGDVVGVFILPPALGDLDQRLRARAGDDAAEIALRMAKAREEIAHWPEFDHVVVNDNFGAAVEAVRAVLHAARLATARQTSGLREFVAGLGT